MKIYMDKKTRAIWERIRDARGAGAEVQAANLADLAEVLLESAAELEEEDTSDAKKKGRK